MHKDKIGIIGLGKLGLPMMAAFVSQGFDPLGYDINKQLIKTLRTGNHPYKEPGIQEIIEHDSRWGGRFYDEMEPFLFKVNIVFIIVPTPSKGDIFNIDFLEEVLMSINRAKKHEDNLTCVITSTVNPGDCSKLAEKYKSANLDIIYSPEFIALGSVLRDMLHPDIVLLGGEELSAIDKVFSIYSRLYKSHPEYHRLSYFEAETAKIAINTYITTKISYANTIGAFIEKGTGDRAGAQRVLNAIGGDTRIGRKYFKYGVSYGGPCFPRDNRALAAHLKLLEIDASIPEATDRVNSSIIQTWKERVTHGHYDALVLVGIAYKSGTDFLEESFMLKLAACVQDAVDIYYVDENVECCRDFGRITSSADLKTLDKYKNPLIIVNYNNTKINFKEVKHKTVDIWS